MKKNIFLMVLGSFLVFQACQKSSLAVVETAIDATTLPTNATEYIANNYPDAAITTAVALENGGKAAYIVGLDNHEEVAFDRGGGEVGDGHDFHGDNGDFDHQNGGKGHHGNQGGGDGDHHGGHHGDGDHHHGDEISVDSLPAAVQSYLTANYAGYTAKHAEIDTLCSVGAVLEVALFKDSTDRVKLFFDASTNAYLMKGSRVNYTDTPQAVRDFVTATYAGFTPRDRAVKLTLADGSVQYEVFLRNGTTRKKVFVKEDGTLICEQ